MHDFLIGLTFVFFILCPAISASIQIRKVDNQPDDEPFKMTGS
jgi:hypothetical protein